VVRLVLVLTVGLSATSASAQSLAKQGERAFQQCFACHSVDRKEKALPGPNLAGIVGRKAGAEKGFAYSPGLKRVAAKGLAWTPQNLDRFLADPEKVVPHTSMAYFGMKKPQDRQAVIAYLRTKR
jgi:cytochrome c